MKLGWFLEIIEEVGGIGKTTRILSDISNLIRILLAVLCQISDIKLTNLWVVFG
jgi:hypothetical protein